MQRAPDLWRRRLPAALGWLRRYSLTLASTGVALVLAWALAPFFNDAPVPLLLAAVLVGAWVGGLWAGLFTTALAVLALSTLFDLSRASPLVRAEDTAFDLSLFVAVACLISWLIAHLRTINQRLEAARIEAEAAVRTREEFLAAAAHDLKSPLAGISMTAQHARRRLERKQPDTDDDESPVCLLAEIETTARRMAHVLDGLLDDAHLQAGRTIRLQLEPTHLLAVVQRVVAEHQPHAERHPLRVVQAADPVGCWDAVRLGRVVDNLLSNAIKYSPAGGEITLEVAEEYGPTGGQVAALRVRDHGVGIPVADVDRVFERFFRARNVGPIVGTGIGLAGARSIVVQHGGTLTVESRIGAGSTFILRLPL